MGSRRRSFVTTGALLGVAGLVVGLIPASAATTAAIPPLAASTQFDITGVIQVARLDAACVSASGVKTDAQGNPLVAHCGGDITVNGQLVTVPNETVVILPANALTWQELFANAPLPYGMKPTAGGLPQSGLALADNAQPTLRVITYEAHVVGNRVVDPINVNGCTTVGGCDRYIAGLVNISQQSLNNGAGYINFVDYANGVMYVGGTVMPDGLLSTTNPGTKVAINDPVVASIGTGRFSRGAAYDGAPGTQGNLLPQDARFQVDQDNPTILAETGFPMCLPREDPSTVNLNAQNLPDGTTGDVHCPEYNRPVVTANGDQSGITPNPNTLTLGQHYTLFRMDSPANVDTAPLACLRAPCADPRQQAPFEIGDYVTFAGTLAQDIAGNQYVSAHTIVASLGIYTQPRIDPAYNTVDVSLIGTGGLTIFGAGEAAARTRFEGMTTDESRPVEVYGIDIDPVTGATTDRAWGAAMPDAGPPTGAVRGRWRFRPPCTDTTATMLASPGKGCTPPLAGTFLPPTREVRAAVQNVGGTVANPTLASANTVGGLTSANGINYGQYHAPIQEYIFPENVPGTPIPENNFNTIPFLAFGGYKSSTNVQAKVLTPWPSNVLPTSAVCASANAGGPYTVANAGGTVTLTGTAGSNLSGTVSYSWSAPSKGTLNTILGQTVVYTAGNNVLPASDQVTLTVTQTGAAGCPSQTTSVATINYNPNSFQPLVNTPTFNSNATIQGNVSVATTVDPKGTQTTVTLSAAGTFRSGALASNTTFQGQYRFTQVGGPTVSLGTGLSGSVSCPIKATTTTGSCGAPTGSLQFTIPVGFIAPANNPLRFTATLLLNTTNPVLSTLKLPITSNPSPAKSIQVIPPSGVAANIALTTVQYDANGGPQGPRLNITATYTGADATVAPTAVLKLLPFLAEDGTIFVPASSANTFTNTGAGIYTLTLVGTPRPYCGNPTAYATPCVTPAATPVPMGPGIVVEAFAAATAKTRPNSLEGYSPVIGTALTSIR